MLYDVSAQTRRREAERALNQPVVVEHPSLSLADLPRDRDAAVLAWFDKVCEFYDVDPAAASRWELLAMRLALERFPNFRLVSSQRKVGNPGTKNDVMDLFHAFQSYKPPRGRGSKYKKFWLDHRTACEKCNIKKDTSLKQAMLNAHQRHEADRRDQELLIRHAIAMALGTTT